MAEIKIENAREEEQARRMLEAQSNGVCYLCKIFEEWQKHFADPLPNNNERFPHVGEYWFVKKNDFPYKGSVHHYLIVSRKHITNLNDVEDRAVAGLELFGVIEFLSTMLNVSGFSLFVRSGDMAFTGATLDHLHFHFLVGVSDKNGSEKIKVPLGFKKQEP